MDIVRIEKINLVDAVYTQLRDLLISGKWPEGTKIPSENELCKEFSVSRVVIREALQKLRGEKLLVTRQGVGTYAANPSNFEPTEEKIVLSEKLYRDFLDFREAVENTAVKLSRQTATEEEFLRMEQCVDAMQAAYKDNEAYNLADFNFHLAVVSASHNDLLMIGPLAPPQPLGQRRFVHLAVHPRLKLALLLARIKITQEQQPARLLHVIK